MTVRNLTTLCSNAHDKAAMNQHPQSHLLIISCVLCKDGSGNCEQLEHWGAFGSKCLDAQRRHGSDDESGDDTISAAVWEAMSVQRISFSVGKSVFI